MVVWLAAVSMVAGGQRLGCHEHSCLWQPASASRHYAPSAPQGGGSMTDTGLFFSIRSYPVLLERDVVLDPDLSYEALGVWVAMLAMPKNAERTVSALTGRGFGRDRVTRAVSELERYGLVYRWERRVPEGHGLLTQAFERPAAPLWAFRCLPVKIRPFVTECLSVVGVDISELRASLAATHAPGTNTPAVADSSSVGVCHG